jgi:hypothetical protein
VFVKNLTRCAQRSVGGLVASFCTGCGNSMAVGERFCRVCGRNSSAAPAAPSMVSPSTTAPPLPAAAAETSGKAVGSLVCGLFFWILPVSIVAIILGHISLSDIRKSAGRLKGDGLAIAGLVLGYMGLAVIPVLVIAAIAIPNLLHARIAANESSAVAGVRTLAVAEINYSSMHRKTGFTCSLSDLESDHLIPQDLASNRKNGYVFELQQCTPDETGANTKFQVVAYPATANQSGKRAFCSDESGAVKVDAEGSAQGCVDNGSLLQ